jgi:hypothetical protein
MGSTNPQRWARVRGVPGMHLPGLRPGEWYRVVEAPPDAAAHMRDDRWLEVDARVQWFGRPKLLEIRKESDLD